MSIKGLDLSYHNAGVNFEEIVKQGYEFVILRIGYRGWSNGKIVKDTQFENFFSTAKKLGLDVGVYFFSQAINAKEGQEEAKFVLDTLGGRALEYPVYIDTELSGSTGNVGRADKISKRDRTEAVKAFCKYVESKKHYAGIYCSESWLANNIYYNELKPYDKWLAKWSIYKPTKKYGNYGMWQNTNNKDIDGKRVDANVCYKNYLAIMIDNGLNNYTTSKYDITIKNVSTVQMKEIIEELAKKNVDYEVKEV